MSTVEISPAASAFDAAQAAHRHLLSVGAKVTELFLSGVTDRIPERHPGYVIAEQRLAAAEAMLDELAGGSAKFEE